MFQGVYQAGEVLFLVQAERDEGHEDQAQRFDHLVDGDHAQAEAVSGLDLGNGLGHGEVPRAMGGKGAKGRSLTAGSLQVGGKPTPLAYAAAWQGGSGRSRSRYCRPTPPASAS